MVRGGECEGVWASLVDDTGPGASCPGLAPVEACVTWGDIVDGARRGDGIAECAVAREDVVDAARCRDGPRSAKSRGTNAVDAARARGRDYGVRVDGECVCVGLRWGTNE